MPRAPKTIHSFEWARALGALAIVVLHVLRSCELNELIVYVAPDLVSAETLAFVPFGRWAVPVFFMMSGALLLNPEREMPLSKVARHAWRIIFVLLTFGLAFSLMESVVSADMVVNGAVVAEAVWHVLTGHSWDHLWYLYATLGLYVVTPALRWLVQRVSRRGLALLVALVWLLCCGVPSAEVVLASAERTVPWVEAVSSWFGWAFPVVYYLAGYVLHGWYSERQEKGTALRALIVVAGVAAGVAMSWLTELDLSGFQLPQLALALPLGAAAFLVLERLFERPLEGHRLMATCSSYSFGIYVVHPLFLHLVLDVGPIARMAAESGEGAIIALQLALTVLCVAGSIAVVKAVRRLPGFANKI